MKSPFWRRFPTFAIGLLLGIAFALVYIQQRQFAASIQPLPEVQEDIGAYRPSAALQVRLAGDWKWSQRFPGNLSLFSSQTADEERKLIQTWRLQRDVEDLVFPPLADGQYVLRLDFVLCRAVPGRPKKACVGQTQYFDFRLLREARDSRLVLVAGPKEKQ